MTTPPISDPNAIPPSPLALALLAAIKKNMADNADQTAATPEPTQNDPRPLPPMVAQTVQRDPLPLESAPPQQGVVAPVPIVPSPTPNGPTGALPPAQPSLVPNAPPTPPNPTPAPAPAKPGPLKALLTNFLQGAGAGLTHAAGLPTQYEKQQNAAHLAIAQQGADDTSAYRQAQTGGLEAKATAADYANTQHTIAADDSSVLPQFRGLTTNVGAYQGLQKLSATVQGKIDNTTQQGQNRQDALESQGQNALQLEGMRQLGGNPRDHVVRSVNGVIGVYSKRDGSPVATLGTDTAMLTPDVRARANAKYAAAQVMDANGNPTTVSRMTQLQTGAPTMTEKTTQTLAGDNLGTQTYLNANHAVRDNLFVLQDPQQRAIIARATEDVERNPGAIDSIINSSLQDGLSPQGAQLISAMKQMNEFGATFKKYTGNGGAATDSLRNTIHSNQPSSANSMAVNMNLLRQDEALAEGVQKNLARPTSYVVPAQSKGNTPTPKATPTPPSSSGSFFQKFGGVPIK